MPPGHDRLMKLGLKGKLEEELKALEDRAEGIIESIQSNTFVMSTVWNLDGEKIRNYGRELAEVIRQGNELRNRIEELKADLGEI